MKGFGAGGMQALMRQANQMQARMKKAQEELAQREFEVTTGGGAILVKIRGDYQVTSVEVQPDVFTSGDREMLQDLVVSVMNEAYKLVKTTSDEQMAKITGGVSMPGMF